MFRFYGNKYIIYLAFFQTIYPCTFLQKNKTYKINNYQSLKTRKSQSLNILLKKKYCFKYRNNIYIYIYKKNCIYYKHIMFL